MKFNPSELKKFFKPGDHVRITGGRHENMTGSVVSVNENEVIVLSDLNMDEVGERAVESTSTRTTLVESSAS